MSWLRHPTVRFFVALVLAPILAMPATAISDGSGLLAVVSALAVCAIYLAAAWSSLRFERQQLGRQSVRQLLKAGNYPMARYIVGLVTFVICVALIALFLVWYGLQLF